MRHTRSTLDRILANAAISLIGLALLLVIAPMAEAQQLMRVQRRGGRRAAKPANEGAERCLRQNASPTPMENV